MQTSIPLFTLSIDSLHSSHPLNFITSRGSQMCGTTSGTMCAHMSNRHTYNSFIVMLFSIAILLFSTTVDANVQSSMSATSLLPTLTGTIEQPHDEQATNLSIVVVSGATGSVIESAPVLRRSTFTLVHLRSNPGLYMLRVEGSMEREYNTLIVNVDNDSDRSILSVLSRSQPRHAQVIPSSSKKASGSKTTKTAAKIKQNPLDQIHFSPLRKTAYQTRVVIKRSLSWYVWFIPLFIWRNKIYVFAGLALAFIVWFPHIVNKLPPEMREELTGEKEPDLGDPNQLVKTLMGEEAFGVRSDVSNSATNSQR